MPKHALLSASSSHRWINCPPSARLCAEHDNKSSSYAQQGTDAHSLCQYKLEKALGISTQDPTKNLEYYDMEMENCADEYASFILEQIEEVKHHCSDPLVLIEQRLDFSKYVEEGFGTGDCVIVADGILQAIDYKHGLGILVSAEKNSQMMCYALGALELFDGIYDVAIVKMTVFQPRKGNISTYTLSREELLKWGNEVLSPIAKLAYVGEGEFKAGGHCQFCKIKSTCRKRAEYNLELAKYDFEMPDTLDSTEIEVILSKADNLVAWVNDIKEYALREALSGTKYDGFKIVEGRSTRKYTDEQAVAEAVNLAGCNPYEQKLLGVTAMTSTLGKKKFEEILGNLIYKAPGKPTLVREGDKRPAMNTAQNDFIEE
ncbi:DUF2800 domain-containing protein [Clostridium grantii]|uniref:DUF2800 domain-containing protein n=1 Tax=Clostridium grantii DSM 8605 TaxID=1121316 RepID=A0A1M5U6Q1_9CLOT|nr:DUF2800 domain-containing protein [Clostridium grantii]SHH58722.1 Protein of unknown function [Clostridium grantii DSM 8605]